MCSVCIISSHQNGPYPCPGSLFGALLRDKIRTTRKRAFSLYVRIPRIWEYPKADKATISMQGRYIGPYTSCSEYDFRYLYIFGIGKSLIKMRKLV